MAILALALWLRVVRLDYQPLWWDEGYSVWFAHQPLADMVRLTAEDIHPPLYYALLGGWSQLLGLAPAALRLFSVAAGVLAVALAYSTGRFLGGRPAGLLAAFLLAINPFHIFYAQEVRMYALVVVWALLGTGMAARWLGVRLEQPPGVTGTSLGTRWPARYLVGYVVALALALYTQYYAAFLAAGLALAGLWILWQQRAPWRAVGAWVGAQGMIALLVLPWLLYATPRLVSYVSQKIIADSDRPLGLIAYLARHLSAFGAGHLEGPLAPWWFIGLLGLVPLAWAWIRLARQPDPGAIDTVGFLLITLATVLGLGWLVNLSFPFFPVRGERLLLLGLPVYVLLLSVSVVAAQPRLTPGRPALAPVALLVFAGLAALSLAAYYVVPRYQGEDYRPLIGQVNQWGRPQDTVFAVFPWQVGYFWSYGDPSGPQPVLSPEPAWGPAVAEALEDALARGHVWFPEHLALGGFLERAVEGHLGQRAHLLANRWYSPSTRLTGWAAPGPAGAAAGSPGTPLEFANGLRLVDATVDPTDLAATNEAVLFTLGWENASSAPGRRVSLRLADADGRTWASQDFTPFTAAGPDLLGLVIPSGTPPGTYQLWVSTRVGEEGQPLEVLGPDGQVQGTEGWLGEVSISAPARPPSPATLALAQPLEARLDEVAQLLGFSATSGTLAPGDDLEVSLFWRALAGLPGAGDWSVFLQLLDAHGEVAAAWEGPPVTWHPTGTWQPGELVRSQHTLRLPATLADGRYQLITGLFDPATNARLAVEPGRPRQAEDFVPLRPVQVVGRKHVMAAPQPQVPLEASLARVGRLVGYDQDAGRAQAGQALPLTLHWQATETTGDRLKVFVHLLDRQGNIVAQSDAEPGGGAYPTSSWLPGEYVADRHVLAIPPDAVAGPATLVVGLYDPASRQRVPWVGATGEVVGDQLPLPEPVDLGRLQ